MSSLAVFSPMSLRAGTDDVGASPRFARVGLVSWRDMHSAYGPAMLEFCRTAAHLAILLAPLLLAATPRVHAQSADPLHSPECTVAQKALARAQQDALAKLADAKDRLEAARKQAQLACLGPESRHGERVGAPDPSITVPPPRIDVPRRRDAVAPAAPPPSPPPMVTPGPAAITSCDPGGCWDSEGRRLNQVGPMLVGPRGGACTVQGGVVLCP